MKIGKRDGCHDSCDFNWWYSRKKANLPALVCSDSEHDRFGAVALKFNQICKELRVGSHGGWSTETKADYVGMLIVRICTESLLQMMKMLTDTQGWLNAAGARHEYVVLKNAAKQRLTYGF